VFASAAYRCQSVTSLSAGVPKGIKHVVMERGLWVPGMRGKCEAVKDRHTDKCCAMGALMACEDFSQPACHLEEVITNREHKSIFLPKYRRACLVCVPRVSCVTVCFRLRAESYREGVGLWKGRAAAKDDVLYRDAAHTVARGSAKHRPNDDQEVVHED